MKKFIFTTVILSLVIVSCHTSANIKKTISNCEYIVLELESDSIPTDFFLGKNYTNPFGPVYYNQLNVADTAWLKIKFYDVKGEMKVLIYEGILYPAIYRIQWPMYDDNNKSLDSGVYTISVEARVISDTTALKTDDSDIVFQASEKVILLK